MEFISISEIPKHEGKKVKIRGWVYRERSGKDMAFIVLKDSSGIVQCTVKAADAPKDFKKASKITVESSAHIKGTVKKDERAPGGYEITVKKLDILQLADRFPITKDQSPEFLLDVRHLAVRTRRMSAIWKIRSAVFWAIREFFTKEGYYETHAPFTTMLSESGLELFEVDYFGKKIRLSQTWQFYSEALLPALEKIFTIGPSFRAEKSKTARHLTEYWHAEVETAWQDLDGLAKQTEDLISYICQYVAKKHPEELKFLGRDPADLKKIKPPFPRITYKEAMKKLEADGIKIPFGKDLRTVEEKALMKHYDKPLIVTHYPKETMAFYKPRDPEDPEVALCLDVLMPEIGFEIIGGSVRDLDIKEMTKALIKKKEDPKHYEWYFDTRRYGAVPHAGFGFGVERMIQWICKLESIKDAIPFPRTPERVHP